jgi:hypothetical protein
VRLTIFIAVCFLVGGVLTGGGIPFSTAADSSAELTREGCVAAVEQARALAMALPDGDVSRYFAERHLHQAMIEAGNGEFDDCLEWTERAIDEVKERRHTLEPGETLKVLRPDE